MHCLKVNPIGERKTKAQPYKGKFADAAAAAATVYDIVLDTLPCTQLVITSNSDILHSDCAMCVCVRVCVCLRQVPGTKTKDEETEKQSLISIYVLFFAFFTANAFQRIHGIPSHNSDSGRERENN